MGLANRETVLTLIVAVAIAAAGIKLVQLARPRPGTNRPAVAAMCGAILTIGLAVLQEQPTNTAVLNAALGWELGYAERHTPALISFFCLRMAFQCWVWPPGRQRRRRVWVHTALVGVVLVARWILAAVSRTGEARAALAGYWSLAPTTAVAMLLYVLYMIIAVLSITALAVLWARQISRTRRWTAWGLICIAIGAAGYALYLVHKMFFLAVELALGRPPYDQISLEVLIQVPATLFLLVGLAMPLVATGVPAAVHLARQRAAYGRLGPLWMALTGHQPDVVLSSRPDWVPDRLGPVWDRISLSELGFRLYRRVIECWDVIVGLHQYLDGRLRDEVFDRARADGVDTDVAHAIAEAVMIRNALELAHRQEEPVPEHFRARPRDSHPSLVDNVGWWQRVARAWGHPVTASLSPVLSPLP